MSERKDQLPVIIVTGLSGAGKSSALRVFEDMGFFCVDGLPPDMVPRLVGLFVEQRRGRGLAIGLDIRQQELPGRWESMFAELERDNVELHVVFLEAGLDELMRRYAETRRPHPLESESLGLRQALENEGEMLAPIRNRASLVIDTSQYSIHDLRRRLQETWSFLRTEQAGMRVHIITFGFKYGPPREADLVFDLRFLPNPYFDEALKPMTGREPKVAAYVLDNPTGREFSERFLDFMTYLVPLYATEGRYRLTIALGCTGGRHRSVAVGEMLFKALKQKGFPVTLEHRHVERG